MKWYGKHEEVSDEIIREVANELGVIFPEDYIAIAKVNHGGSPELEVLDILNRKECVLDRLLSFKSDKGTIKKTIEILEDRLSKELIPFASDPFGNYYCFRYDDNQMEIVLWNHEKNTQEFVAKSFTEMMNMLYIPS